MFGQLKETLTKQEIDSFYHEPFINTGYRQAHQPWSYYILSLFQRNNEAWNALTHLLGFGITVVRFIEFSADFDMIGDHYMWPLLVGFLSMASMYLCSSGAHMFANRSKVAHYTGFACDYAGISLYGIGSVMLHYRYCTDDSLRESLLYEYAIPLGVFIAIIICICGGISKVCYSMPYPFERKLWLLIPVGAIYTLLEIPIIHRFVLLASDGKWDESLPHHAQQLAWFLTSAMFFGSHVPERCCPGQFDYIGHSHQIFHVCIIFVTNKQLDAVRLDIERLGNMSSLFHPTFWNTIGAIIIVGIANVLTVLTYNRLTTKREHHHSNQKNS